MGGWIGVDLDGTLAEYHGWVTAHPIGKPIPKMVDRVKGWIESGMTVKVITARVSIDPDGSQAREIADWTERHVGTRLEVTCCKDYSMMELWDDRAVGVIMNTGERADGKP